MTRHEALSAPESAMTPRLVVWLELVRTRRGQAQRGASHAVEEKGAVKAATTSHGADIVGIEVATKKMLKVPTFFLFLLSVCS